VEFIASLFADRPSKDYRKEKMSRNTLRKRIALTSVVALAAGLLSVAPANAYDTNNVFGTVVSNGTRTAYTDGSTEYATFLMAAGATEKVTLVGYANPADYFVGVNITGGTGVFTRASQAFKTGTVQDNAGLYCAYSATGTAYGSATSSGVFGASGSDVELLSPAIPTGYEFSSGSWALGDLCGEFLGDATPASVTIPATAAGQIGITVTSYDSLSYITTQQRITVNVSAAVSTEYGVSVTCVSSNDWEDDCATDGSSGYGYFAQDGAMYSPAGSHALAARFEVLQKQSNGNTSVDVPKAKSMEWLVTGPGCIKSFTIGSTNCDSGVNVTRLSLPAGTDNRSAVRLFADGTAGTSTLTVKVNGVVVKTWTIKFFGQAKTIAFVPLMTIGQAGELTGYVNDWNSSNLNHGESISLNSGTDAAYAWVAKDANGTAIPRWEIDQTGNYYVTSSNSAVIDRPCDDSIVEDGTGLYATGIWHTLCEFGTASGAASGSTADVIVTIFNNDGTTVTASQKLTVGGDVKTVTVALDKTSYVVGNPASIVLTAKDASGNPVWDGASVLTPAGLASNLSTAGSGTLATTTTVVGGKATVKTFAPVVPGTWTISGTDVNGGAVTASATITNANDERLASLITKINALTKLIKKIQKKVGVK